MSAPQLGRRPEGTQPAGDWTQAWTAGGGPRLIARGACQLSYRGGWQAGTWSVHLERSNLSVGARLSLETAGHRLSIRLPRDTLVNEVPSLMLGHTVWNSVVQTARGSAFVQLSSASIGELECGPAGRHWTHVAELRFASLRRKSLGREARLTARSVGRLKAALGLAAWYARRHAEELDRLAELEGVLSPLIYRPATLRGPEQWGGVDLDGGWRALRWSGQTVAFKGDSRWSVARDGRTINWTRAALARPLPELIARINRSETALRSAEAALRLSGAVTLSPLSDEPLWVPQARAALRLT